MQVRDFLSTCQMDGIVYSKSIKTINEMKLPDFTDINPVVDVELKAMIKKIKEGKDRLDKI
jgi:hypothetical protein